MELAVLLININVLRLRPFRAMVLIPEVVSVRYSL